MASSPPFTCPFCGRPGPRTREHVWAQWMRESPGARRLLAGATGKRTAHPLEDFIFDDDGRLNSVTSGTAAVAELLPHVWIPVCGDCNGGWMSRLEDQVRTLLKSWTLTRWPIQLSASAQTLLSAWATKSWMAYALIRGRDEGPFASGERLAMTVNAAALARSRVWLVHSDAPTAQVGMSLFPMVMAGDDEVHQVATMDSNAGFGHVSYDGLVFFLALAREGDDTFLNHIESQIDEIGPIKRIWPPSNEQHFPGAQAPPHVVSDLFALADAHQRVYALPTVGLTLAEMEEAHRAQSLGATPLQIRAIWQPESLAQFERKRLEDDPDGYGRTWEPYKILGGIEWHGGRFDEAVEIYEQAQTNGATTHDIGSQMCDALLLAGRYEDAQAVADEVDQQGPNEWQDAFRSAILFELVDELGLRRQNRQLRTAGGTIEVNDESTRAAYEYLETTDALDMPSWAVIAQDDPAGARISRIMASAYLGEAEEAWFLLSAAAYHWPDDEPLKQPVLEGLRAQPPETHAFIRDVLADEESPETVQLLDYLEANVLTRG